MADMPRQRVSSKHNLRRGLRRLALRSLPVAMFSAIVVLPCIASADVFRCVIDGRVTYTDRPCLGTTVPIANAVAAPAISGPADHKLQVEASSGHVVVGMTMSQVRQAWGDTEDVMLETDVQGPHEQWNYSRNGRNFMLRFDDGKVARITERKAEPPSATSGPPLTISEMEEMERAEKAAERKFVREGMMQEEVRGRLGPPNERRIRPINWGTADCWAYHPSPKDQQTLTVLCFNILDTRLVGIERTVQR